MRSKTMFIVIGIVIGLLLAAAGIVVAGSLNPGSGPTGAGSQMYTLEQIYQRLTTGAYFTKQSGFTEPASGPTAGTMRTLDQIMAQTNRVPKTGQTTCYDSGGAVIACAGTGQDGQYQKGRDPAVAPTGAYNTPARFTDNLNGTVTDNMTALIWLKNASCGGAKYWGAALTFANSLYDGWTGDGSGGDCALSDGSTAGQWRLPNVNELHSLGPTWPPGAPFGGVQSAYYWSSTSYADYPTYAWIVNLYHGLVDGNGKTVTLYVWPVRGGQ